MTLIWVVLVSIGAIGLFSDFVTFLYRQGNLYFRNTALWRHGKHQIVALGVVCYFLVWYVILALCLSEIK